jgi:hypothetical protein
MVERFNIYKRERYLLYIHMIPYNSLYFIAGNANTRQPDN